MSTQDAGTTQANVMDMPNGPGAAAILSAGIGCFLVPVLAIVADQWALMKSAMNFYRPTGPLSGVTTTAVLIWLVMWFVLAYLWRRRNVALARICAVAVALLALSVLLTFPPIADLF
jgi:hypothetical protein